MMRRLGFVENEQWVRTTLTVNAPLEVVVGSVPGEAPNELALEQQNSSPVIQAAAQHAEELVIVMTEKARSPLAVIINVIFFSVAVAAFANTNIYAQDMFRGMLLPLLGVALLLYFSLIFISMRYRKHADSSARTDQLFRTDD